MKTFLKSFRYSYSTALAFLLIGLATSCQDELLEENPRGFLTPENALITVEGFESAVAELQRQARGLRTSDAIEDIDGGVESDKAITTMYANGTDLAWFVVPSQNQFTDYSLINPTNTFVTAYWTLLYKIINNANTIISYLPDAPIEQEDKLSIEANARFFRAFAYRYLVHLWGDVPIVQDQITAPKFDFSRDPVNEVLTFMRDDLTFAAEHLPEVNPGDGRLSKAAAEHVLAETHISLGNFDDAVAVASRVIDDGQYALMQERFGNHTSLPGDVFWDLFRSGNQNRSSGNTESIWVWQLDFAVPNGDPDHRFTRAWAPRLEQLNDSEGLRAIVPADTLGRGVGFVKPTYYLDTLIWLDDFEGDIRNSSYNMQRTYYINNTESAEFGQPVQPEPSDLDRNHFVFVKKAASPEGYPQGYDRNGRMYTDIYAIRLAETYLLRAEAHLRKGDQASATADINIIRARAQATPATPAEVTIDYLLNERARELVAEEPRRLTLARFGKLVERVSLYNPVSGPTIQEYHALLPIPQSEIDANIEADLRQNPGYGGE